MADLGLFTDNLQYKKSVGDMATLYNYIIFKNVAAQTERNLTNPH